MTTHIGGQQHAASRLLAYAMPTIALQSMMVPLLLYLLPAYTSSPVSMSLATVSAMLLVGRTFELVSDPIVGAISDRLHLTFGGRWPLMALGTPIACLATWFLVMPPAGASGLYLASFLILFYLGWTLVYIPHQSWGGEISNDYQERTRIAGFRETMAFVGFLLASVVPLVYWKFWRGVDAPSFAQIVQAIGIFFVVALPISVLVCQRFAPRSMALAHERVPSWRELMAILMRNKLFARLTVAYVVDRLALGVYFTAQPFFIGMVLGLQADVLTVAITNTIAGACLAPLWVPITRRLSKHRAYVLANLATMASFVLSLFAPPHALALILFAQVLMGFGNAGTLITPPAMTADTVDHDELRSGVRQMGGHMAFLAIVYKGGIMLGAPLALALMSYYGVQSSSVALSDSAAWGVRLCASVVPAALLLVPIFLMWRFPLDARRHAGIVSDLRRAQAERRSSSPSSPAVQEY